MTALDVAVLGHATRDLIGNDVRLGGALSFATRAAASLGLRTAAVTAAPPDFELLDPLRDDPRVELVVVPAARPTTFELDYSGPVRRVRLVSRAPALAVDDVPAHLRAAAIAFVAPVASECGADLVRAFPMSRVVVGAQGWMRTFAEDGAVIPALGPEVERPPDGIDLVVFSELDHPDAEAVAARFAERARVVALTRGQRGATILTGGKRHHVTATRARESDPTGAGDVYGLVLAVAMHRGLDPLAAAALAGEAAARVVEGPGIGRLATFASSRAWRDLVAVRAG